MLKYIKRIGANNMDIKEIKGNTYCIDTGITYIPFYKFDDDKIIMLDTGLAKEREGIEELLKSNNLKIYGIINSHAHIDHLGNNAYFKEKYNSIIAMSADEAFYCKSPINLKIYYNNYTYTEIETHYKELICETDILILDHEEKINICGIKFEIIHTPGHSPAHICIVTPDNIAYMGDSLISHEVMKLSKMPYSYVIIVDLKTKAKLYELKYNKYVVAHKGIYDDITNLITDNIYFYKGIAEKIYDLIDGDMTFQDIMAVVSSNFHIHIINKNKYAITERLLKSYIEYLHETGRIELSMKDELLKYSKIQLEEV